MFANVRSEAKKDSTVLGDSFAFFAALKNRHRALKTKSARAHAKSALVQLTESHPLPSDR